MTPNVVLHVVSKLVIPPILLFALYVQFHGEYGPGGGFQAGVIFASAVILYALLHGVAGARRVVPVRVLEPLTAVGLLLFAGVGVAAQLGGDNFLDYDVFAPHHPSHGQHLGILLVELGVGITVAAVMIRVFFAFAGREAGDEDGED